MEKIEPSDRQAVPALIELLNDSNEYVRRNATSALGEIGPHANQAVPALTRALKDKDTDVRKYTAEAIRQLNSKIEVEMTDETEFNF